MSCTANPPTLRSSTKVANKPLHCMAAITMHRSDRCRGRPPRDHGAPPHSRHSRRRRGSSRCVSSFLSHLCYVQPHSGLIDARHQGHLAPACYFVSFLLCLQKSEKTESRQQRIRKAIGSNLLFENREPTGRHGSRYVTSLLIRSQIRSREA
eukprot:SAG11_NODE_2607_length_3175_cov_11.018205_3_plen_152_part_00